MGSDVILIIVPPGKLSVDTFCSSGTYILFLIKLLAFVVHATSNLITLRLWIWNPDHALTGQYDNVVICVTDFSSIQTDLNRGLTFFMPPVLLLLFCWLHDLRQIAVVKHKLKYACGFILRGRKTFRCTLLASVFEEIMHSFGRLLHHHPHYRLPNGRHEKLQIELAFIFSFQWTSLGLQLQGVYLYVSRLSMHD